MPWALQVLLFSMYHVDHAINRRRSRALGTIEGEIPSPAAGVAAIEAKVAIPKDTQACVGRLFLKNTFLKKSKGNLRNQIST